MKENYIKKLWNWHKMVFNYVLYHNGTYNILCFGVSGDIAPTDMADLRLKGGKQAKVCGILTLSKRDQIKY